MSIDLVKNYCLTPIIPRSYILWSYLPPFSDFSFKIACLKLNFFLTGFISDFETKSIIFGNNIHLLTTIFHFRQLCTDQRNGNYYDCGDEYHHNSQS